MQGLLIRDAERREKTLTDALNAKLCSVGRVMSDEVIAIEKSPYGGHVEYRMPTKERPQND